ncbi:MAG: DnaB-like helicase C-terminal domain-containing protein [Candidatus Paceibacterota bacterium]
MKIERVPKLLKKSFKELGAFQKGEKRLIKTGYECIDCHIGGALPGDIILISALSGQGKSETLFRMKDNILNPAINEGAENFAFLDISLEMKMFNIVLRSVHRKLNKTKRQILFEEFTEEEKKIAKAYYDSVVSDERQYISQTPTTSYEFYEGTKKFLQEHADKEAVFVTLDHMLLISGGDKKKALEETIEYMNRLKLEFDNCYFIILSQMNRSILGRIADKDNNSAPNTGDQYGSEFMNQVCSYNIVLFNAYKVGIDKYLKVNPNRYDYLAEHFAPGEGKKRSFETVGKLFFHVLKVREGEAVFKDLFIEDMDMDQNMIEQLKQESEDKDGGSVVSDDDEVPVFGETVAMKNARDNDNF